MSKARKSTPFYILNGETGTVPVLIQIKTKMISFWTRLLLRKESKFSFLIYKHMFDQDGVNFK